jgi:hypothetical protein
MKWTDALIAIPPLVELPSGLLVPSDSGRPTVVGDGSQFADGTRISDDALVVMSNVPSSFEQMRVVIDESGVGLPVSSRDQLRSLVSELSFENTMLAIARLASHTWQMRGDVEQQLALAPTIFGDRDLVEQIKLLTQREPDRMEIFPEQHAAILQRLLVLFARDGDLGKPAPPEQRIFNRAWLAAASPTADLERNPPTGPEGRREWIAFLIQNGSYNRQEDSLSSMIRPQILFSDIASSEAARAHQDFCDLNEWHLETFKLGLADQFALGFVVAATADVFDADTDLSSRALVGRDWLTDVSKRLGHPLDDTLDLLSATRDWYRNEFQKRDDSEANTAWDRIPFEIRPLLRLSNDELVAVSPRVLEGWLGDGFYHRSLFAARERGKVQQFQRFYGYLVEEHVLRVLRHVHPADSPLGVSRVFGEQPYGRGGGKKSPDVAVDAGTDLVLLEVNSGRFTIRTVIEGSPEAALKDLGRLIFNKAEQLDRRISDFLKGDWTLPDVEHRKVTRIWPVIVSADVLQNEMLWDEIRDRLKGVFSQPKVQRLTLLDISELEQLASLVERGHHLVDLIATKAGGPYAELDFRRFVEGSPNLPNEDRLSLLDERWLREVDRAAEAFGFDPQSDEARLRRRELRKASVASRRAT